MLIKVILVQIALTRAQNANQNHQSGDAIDDQIPHICPPPLGLDIDRCNYMQVFFVFSCNVPQSISSMLLWDL